MTIEPADLAAAPGPWRTRRELGRTLGQLVDRALEGGAVGRIDGFGKLAGEIERDRREIVVHVASGRRQRQKSFAQVGAIGPPRHQLAPFQQRDRARHLGLVHVAVRADRLAGHHAELAERDQHAPFRHADAVAVGIDARERLRHQARADVEAIGQEFFELEWVVRRRRRSRLRRSLRAFLAHIGCSWLMMRVACVSGCAGQVVARTARTLAEVATACNEVCNFLKLLAWKRDFRFEGQVRKAVEPT